MKGMENGACLDTDVANVRRCSRDVAIHLPHPFTVSLLFFLSFFFFCLFIACNGVTRGTATRSWRDKNTARKAVLVMLRWPVGFLSFSLSLPLFHADPTRTYVRVLTRSPGSRAAKSRGIRTNPERERDRDRDGIEHLTSRFEPSVVGLETLRSYSLNPYSCYLLLAIASILVKMTNLQFPITYFADVKQCIFKDLNRSLHSPLYRKVSFILFDFFDVADGNFTL